MNIDDYKTKAVAALWRRFKDYQRKYVDPEDLTLAQTLMMAKEPKGTAVAMWVQNLWSKYYEIKASIQNAPGYPALFSLDIRPQNAVPPPPYTIEEVSEAASALYPLLTAQNSTQPQE